MLKIRDDIPLEELEKYGFEKEKMVGNAYMYHKITEKGVREHITIYCENRIIATHSKFLLDTLYDLIQAGIVVKE